FDSPRCGVDASGIAVDAENPTGRGHQFGGDDRHVAAARAAIEHTHTRTDPGRSKQPLRCRTQRVTLGREPLAFPVRVPPGVPAIHKTNGSTAMGRDSVKPEGGSGRSDEYAGAVRSIPRPRQSTHREYGMGLIHIELFATLDLVGQAPGGPDEDPDG